MSSPIAYFGPQAAAIVPGAQGVLSINGKSGAISQLAEADIANLSTDLATIAAAAAAAQATANGNVIDSIADTDTTHAPSRNAVFDALALKAATTYVDSQDTATLNTATGRAIAYAIALGG